MKSKGPDETAHALDESKYVHFSMLEDSTNKQKVSLNILLYYGENG